MELLNTWKITCGNLSSLLVIKCSKQDVLFLSDLFTFSPSYPVYEMILSPSDPFSVKCRADSWLTEEWLGLVASSERTTTVKVSSDHGGENPEPSLWNQTPNRDLYLFRSLNICIFGYIPGANPLRFSHFPVKTWEFQLHKSVSLLQWADSRSPLP